VLLVEAIKDFVCVIPKVATDTQCRDVVSEATKKAREVSGERGITEIPIPFFGN
jgi:hypothetical protein